MSPFAPDRAQFAALLEALTPLGGLSGHEGAVARHMADALRATASTVMIDRIGNLVARYGPPDAARTIAVLAHMDTVGFMVKAVDARAGMLRVVPVGGVNIKALPGAAVTVWDCGAPHQPPRLPGIPGVIGVRSQHLARPGNGAIAADDLYVQVDPAAAAQIRVTTPVTYAPQTVRQGDLYSSPYLDDRAGCAVLLALGAWLAGNVPDASAVYLVGTVQEETTCAGALAALRAIEPDVALFVDGTLSYDTPDTRDRGAVRLGGGPVLTSFLYTSGLNGWHADPLFRAALCEKARERHIPYQEDAIRGLMSDARAATMLGIPSALVGIPMRGKHAPLETLHLDDLAHTAQVVATALFDLHTPQRNA